MRRREVQLLGAMRRVLLRQLARGNLQGDVYRKLDEDMQARQRAESQ